MEQRSALILSFERRRHLPIPAAKCGSLFLSALLHAVLLVLATKAVFVAPIEREIIRVTIQQAAPPRPAAQNAASVSAPVVSGSSVRVPAQVPHKRKPVPRPVRKPISISRPAVGTVERGSPFDQFDASDREAQPSAGDVAVIGGSAGGTVGGTAGDQGHAILTADQIAWPPVVIERSSPTYPQIARLRRTEGLVVLEVVVGLDGRVESDRIRVVRSIPMLEDAAIAAVRRWRFRPGRDARGRPVRVLVEIPIRFQLR